MSLQTFKFVSIKFRETGDSSTLHADINLTPQQKKSIRMQVQGVTKSNNFVGPGFEVTYTNRNFFRGAELFQFKLSGAYEWQISRQQAGSINALEFGAEASLTFPRFVIPIKIRNESSKYVPQTIIKAGFDFQQRLKYYRLTSFTTGIGYQWRETTHKSHELFPVELSYLRTSRTSAEFDSLLMDNPSLANSFQNQFIPGVRYVYTLNTQLRDGTEKNYQPNKIKRSNFFFQGTIGLAGNIINGLQSTKSEEEPGTLFNLPYSQYVRGETDFRYYLQLDQHNKIATRLNIGVGYAYGNSTNLPYIKQFAVGGSNSLRAFPARSVGPGTYNVRADSTFTSDTYFIDQRGDIKLEANIEYRFDIFKGLKGAVFVDAGNIWLIRNDEARPGGQFEWDTFLGELAVGTGVGIRYDFNFFVLRLDTAFPLRKAYLPVGQRWVVDQIDFGSSSWRKENLVFNIAIGYPF
jgi:outer membrane translocation and assembly module TamA